MKRTIPLLTMAIALAIGGGGAASRGDVISAGLQAALDFYVIDDQDTLVDLSNPADSVAAPNPLASLPEQTEFSLTAQPSAGAAVTGVDDVVRLGLGAAGVPAASGGTIGRLGESDLPTTGVFASVKIDMPSDGSAAIGMADWTPPGFGIVAAGQGDIFQSAYAAPIAFSGGNPAGTSAPAADAPGGSTINWQQDQIGTFSPGADVPADSPINWQQDQIGPSAPAAAPDLTALNWRQDAIGNSASVATVDPFLRFLKLLQDAWPVIVIVAVVCGGPVGLALALRRPRRP